MPSWTGLWSLDSVFCVLLHWIWRGSTCGPIAQVSRWHQDYPRSVTGPYVAPASSSSHDAPITTPVHGSDGDSEGTQENSCCIPTCQYGGQRDRRRTMLTCAWCSDQFHATCCLPDRDLPAIFTCPGCRTMPSQIRALTISMTSMQRYLSPLTKSHNELLLNIMTKDARVDELAVKNMSIRDRISNLTSESQKLQWELHHQNKSTKKLLIGTSIIRDIESAKFVNTDRLVALRSKPWKMSWKIWTAN